jgi:hypothetical protein
LLRTFVLTVVRGGSVRAAQISGTVSHEDDGSTEHGYA